MTTKEDIREWVENAPRGTTHMIVVCDTFSHEDYPVYVSRRENVHDREAEYRGKNMQTVMEVYNLKKNISRQLESNERVFEY
jgi:hypothetical protein